MRIIKSVNSQKPITGVPSKKDVVVRAGVVVTVSKRLAMNAVIQNTLPTTLVLFLYDFVL